MDWSTMFTSRVVVFGVGNILIGDDAVGPRVVEYLQQDPEMPGDVALLDVGTSIRTVLFDLIVAEDPPERVIVVDAMTEKEGRVPGEYWEINVDDMDPKKTNDYSMHMFPTVNMLKDLKENTTMDVKVLVVQTGYIPEEMDERMSPEMEAAVPKVAARVREWCTEGM